MHKALAFLAVALLPLLGAPADTPKLLRPFNVPVNGDGDEDEPPVAGAGRTLYFTAPTGGKDEVRYARRRSAVQPWPARSEVLEDYVKARGELRSVFATAGRHASSKARRRRLPPSRGRRSVPMTSLSFATKGQAVGPGCARCSP